MKRVQENKQEGGGEANNKGQAATAVTLGQGDQAPDTDDDMLQHKSKCKECRSGGNIWKCETYGR